MYNVVITPRVLQTTQVQIPARHLNIPNSGMTEPLCACFLICESAQITNIP